MSECWLFHQWSRWSALIVTKDGEAVQIRTCALCNRHQIRSAQ